MICFPSLLRTPAYSSLSLRQKEGGWRASAFLTGVIPALYTSAEAEAALSCDLRDRPCPKMVAQHGTGGMGKGKPGSAEAAITRRAGNVSPEAQAGF